MKANLVTTFFLKYYLRLPEDFVIFLGKYKQSGSLMAVLYVSKLWAKTTFIDKFLSVIKFRWQPSEKLVAEQAKEVFMNDIFGTENDCGDRLFTLMGWHNSRKWDLRFLTESDEKKIKALQGVSLLTTNLHKEVTSDYLSLNLLKKSDMMSFLVHPLVAKTPVISIRYCLDLHASYSFNSIREAEHPEADDIIAYLYETLTIQQRIASSLHALILLLEETIHKSDETILSRGEMNAIKEANSIISDLKATIEKLIVLIALIYEVKDIETKKTHKQKMGIMQALLLNRDHVQYYHEFIYEMIKSDSIEKLNQLRTGLIHKKGISKLQPHSYISDSKEPSPLFEIFDILMDQHSKNTAIFLGVLACLTDDLIVRKPVSYHFTEIPSTVLPSILVLY